jgi:hypothetical protein
VREAITRLVAREAISGLYFDGKDFQAKEEWQALTLQPGATSKEFDMVYINPRDPILKACKTTPSNARVDILESFTVFGKISTERRMSSVAYRHAA